MALFKGRIFAQVIKRAKGFAKQAFASALETDELLKQKQILETKKAQLAEEVDKLSLTITETMLETASVIAKLRDQDQATSIIGSLTNTEQQGIMFVNYKGEVLFTNTYTQQLLCAASCQLIGQSIESFMIDQRPRKYTVIDFSMRIIKFVTDYPNCAKIPPELLTCKLLNEAYTGPVYASFTSCSATNPLSVEVSLLDTNPQTIEDIIYICKISPYINADTAHCEGQPDT
jgi:hypothetical protein